MPFADFATAAGVAVLSLGGTKNGVMGAEAVVVLNPDACQGATFLRKRHMQLTSKRRFGSVRLIAPCEGDLWLRNAAHGNAMASRLRASLENVAGVCFTQPTQTDGVVARLPAGVADAVRQRFIFYDWDASTGEMRWMCSFDTSETHVDEFAALVCWESSRIRRGRNDSNA